MKGSPQLVLCHPLLHPQAFTPPPPHTGRAKSLPKPASGQRLEFRPGFEGDKESKVP